MLLYFSTLAIRKHPVGMKPKIGKGSASPPQSAPDKATSLRLLRGAPFGLKAEVLNQQGRLITNLQGRLMGQYLWRLPTKINRHF